MKKRWICLYVENEIGVLARISSLFASKSYNLNSLTVVTTEDEKISRMTISLTSDEKSFEQIKKQLDRSVEVIKIVDYTNIYTHMKELLFIKISNCIENDKLEIFRIAQEFNIQIADYNHDTILLECVQSDIKNDDLICLLKKCFCNRIEVVRGGCIAIESISISCR